MLEISPILLSVGLLAGIVLLFMQAASLKSSRMVVGLMILVSSLAVAVDYYGNPQVTFLYPIQTQRSVIYMALGILLFVGLIAHAGLISIRKISLVGCVLLLMGMYQAAMRLIHEGPMPAGETAIFFLVTMLPLILILPVLLRSWDDFILLLRVIVIVGVIWTLGTMIQFLINPSIIIVGRSFRFVGLMGNPQHAAAMLSVAAVTTLWLLLNDTVKRYKPFMLVSFGVFMILVMWTGSRTGIGMFGLGAAAVMYSRMGRTVLLLPFGLLAVYGMFLVTQLLGIDIGADRLVSTENTRAGSWEIMLDNARGNYMFGAGVGEDGAGESESGYLYALAAYGVGMVVLVVALLFAVGIQTLRLLRIKSRLPATHKTLPDLIIGFYAMFFGGSVFEGYMMARVSTPLVELVIFAGMASCLIHMARSGAPDLDDLEYEEYSADGNDYGEEYHDDYDEPCEN